jgi:hypothetical protein
VGAKRESRVEALAGALVNRGMASELAGAVASLLLARPPVTASGGLRLLCSELETRGFAPAEARETAHTLVALTWLDRGFGLDAVMRGLKRRGTAHAEALGAALEARQIRSLLPPLDDLPRPEDRRWSLAMTAFALGTAACAAVLLLVS